MTGLQKKIWERKMHMYLYKKQYKFVAIVAAILIISTVVPITLYANIVSAETEQVEIVPTPIPTITPTPVVVQQPVIKLTPQINIITEVTVVTEPEEILHTYKVGDIDVDIDELMGVYYETNEYGMLTKNTAALQNTCVNFLFEQMGLSPEIVAGIIGNVCNEGHFAQQQGTHAIISNLDDYIYLLESDDGRGYGIAQWTYPTRQDSLRLYLDEAVRIVMDQYDATYEECVYGEYYPTVVIIAELTHLYDELMDYDIFEDYTSYYDLEDATGRIALYYERYKNSKKHWAEDDETGTCYLMSTDSSNNGTLRLEIAKQVYDLMNND